MLDYVMLRHMPGSIYSDSVYRCQSCGQGPVIAGDGFLMNRCWNCGRYHHATDLPSLDLSWLRKKLASFWTRVKAIWKTTPIEDGIAASETLGGVK